MLGDESSVKKKTTFLEIAKLTPFLLQKDCISYKGARCFQRQNIHYSNEVIKTVPIKCASCFY